MARLSRGSEGNSGCTRRVVRRVAGRVELRGRYTFRKKEMGKNRGVLGTKRVRKPLSGDGKKSFRSGMLGRGTKKNREASLVRLEGESEDQRGREP